MLRRIADWLRDLTGNAKPGAPAKGRLVSNAAMPLPPGEMYRAAQSGEEPKRHNLENLPQGELTFLSYEGNLHVGVEGYYGTGIFKYNGPEDLEEITEVSEKLKIWHESKLLAEEELAQLAGASAGLLLATRSAPGRKPQHPHKPSLRFGDLPANTVYFRHEGDAYAMTCDHNMYGAHDRGQIHEIESLEYKLKISLEGQVISVMEALSLSRQKSIPVPENWYRPRSATAQSQGEDN